VCSFVVRPTHHLSPQASVRINCLIHEAQIGPGYV
jgi:hypothetical protein